MHPARSFDRAAEAYERGRPGYPDAALDVVPIASDATVLDLGAGTGKLTRVLVERYAQVVAVEPLDGMRAVLAAVVPSAETLAGSAEAIPLADASVDAVFAGQAAHWFANDRAVAEIARVLRVGGVLAALWNQPREDAPASVPQAYQDRLDALATPQREQRAQLLSWSDAVARGPFGELRSAAVEHEQVADRDAVLALAASSSWIARRADEERAGVLAELAALLPEGEYRTPLRTDVEWTARVTRAGGAAVSSLARSHACVAAVYDRARVEHSREALDLVLRETGLTSSASVVDLAAGTGKLTKLLAERFADVVAIEPEDAMRAYIETDARAGTAEAIPLADASVDAVFAADAFHWFDAPRALNEIARVLRPGGWLVLIWNQWWATEPPLPAKAKALLDVPFRTRARDLETTVDWRDALPHPSFEPESTSAVEDETVLAASDLVELVQTTSSIAALPDDERATLAAQLRELLHGEYRLPMRHELHWMHRR